MQLFVTIAGLRFGFEADRVCVNHRPYLDRWILWLGYGLRIHRFWRGDDVRAPHDHPWDFWTFPLRDYVEIVEDPERSPETYLRRVRAWRWHYRPAEFRHIVLGPFDPAHAGQPFWTIVICSPYRRGWGFWPTATRFVPWRNWK